MTDTYIALLRGINVGGKNKLPMKELAAIFERLGCRDVRTYIQSGNVVLSAESSLAAELPRLVGAAIEEGFGFGSPVILRSADELAQIARVNPFLRDGVDPATLHVAFLANAPTDAAVAKLDPNRSPGDKYMVRGREIYLRCPNGMARTKLTNQYFDATLGTVSTMRNWRTVLKLRDWCAS